MKKSKWSRKKYRLNTLMQRKNTQELKFAGKVRAERGKEITKSSDVCSR